MTDGQPEEADKPEEEELTDDSNRVVTAIVSELPVNARTAEKNTNNERVLTLQLQ